MLSKISNRVDHLRSATEHQIHRLTVPHGESHGKAVESQEQDHEAHHERPAHPVTNVALSGIIARISRSTLRFKLHGMPSTTATQVVSSLSQGQEKGEEMSEQPAQLASCGQR